MIDFWEIHRLFCEGKSFGEIFKTLAEKKSAKQAEFDIDEQDLKEFDDYHRRHNGD